MNDPEGCRLEVNSFGELPEPENLGGFMCCPTHQCILQPVVSRWPRLICPKGGTTWTWSNSDEAWS